tara:strand:- start:1249 stop:1548 length:300 start_codon:yes stop_codon:yes gene_type:complete
VQIFDITNHKEYEEDMLFSLVEILAAEEFEEQYIETDFEGDDVIFRIVSTGETVCEVGNIDDCVYATLIRDRLQYRGTLGANINITDEFNSVYKEYIDG